MKYMQIIFWTLILAFFNMSIASAQDYILGNGDILVVDVYEHPDLKTTVRIGGNGTITLPLIGQVAAADVSVKDLAEKIETLLAEGYVVNPQVNIFIEEFRSQKATVLGEVKSPGLYKMEGYTSLLELISTAGGLTENAAIEIIIHRKDPVSQKENTININLRQLMEKGQDAQNIQVIDGDNIFIPKKKVFYVTGEVKTPDSYNYEDGLTVIQALAMAGGLSDKAAPSRIKIIRTANGQEQLIKGVKMDQSVQPNDVIVVPESYF